MHNAHYIICLITCHKFNVRHTFEKYHVLTVGYNTAGEASFLTSSPKRSSIITLIMVKNIAMLRQEELYIHNHLPYNKQK